VRQPRGSVEPAGPRCRTRPPDQAPPLGGAVGRADTVRGRLGARLERLDDDVAVARLRRQSRLLVDADEPDALRDSERRGGLVFERRRHEVAEDRRRRAGTLLDLAEGPRLIEPDPHAGYEIRREADEPGIEAVVGGAGLSRDRLADA